ncbi:galactose mutarotase-like protein [Nadsonia fulvescens var. elongata DSM 6958]|uniref:Glucose-6-phosphate 1-epimerase n=1 Tax=Nadsonia fulvescens var. elongata DSM 6958 TaxID=857566 RepID=A0A1E3PIX2_9ASCO|nr:galactose mutarotase-like protein [Nadsonia fulvescens var. elongata DSM 6958]
MGVEQLDDCVILTHPSNEFTSVKILHYGATVLSWKVNGQEKLWLSEKAHLDGSKAVRGGIPLVFPVFGKKTEGATATLPQHGFARNNIWEFLGQISANPPTIQYGLGPENLSEETRAQWPHDFTLLFTVVLEEDKLTTSLEVQNNELEGSWDFNALFHTYFRVNDITKVKVHGLTGVSAYDQLTQKSYSETKNDGIIFTEEYDRIYNGTGPNDISITDDCKTLITIESNNINDTVVWNPWIKKSDGMADFSPKDGWKKMVCVERGSVVDWVNLKAGSTWEGSQIFKACL